MGYNRIDRKAYKYYIFCPQQRKILGGYEYREDAQERVDDMHFPNLKIYTRTHLKRIFTDPVKNENWGRDTLAGSGGEPGELEWQLRTEIMRQLRLATEQNVPKVYQRIQSSEGYASMEARIIRMVLQDGITPSACIPQIESEL